MNERVYVYKNFLCIFSGTLLALIVSCGNAIKKQRPYESTVVTPVQADASGHYQAVLYPINDLSEANISGVVDVFIENDKFLATSEVQGTSGGVKHFQLILAGDSCPSIDDDANNDRWIDYNETAVASGKVLIPLDSDLSNQFGGISFGPISNEHGSFIYRRSTSYLSLLSDLRSDDVNPGEAFSKLSSDQNLNLDSRVVVIFAYSEFLKFQLTIHHLNQLPVTQSLPVACGKFIRIR